MYKVEFLNDEGHWETAYWRLSFPEALHHAQRMRREGTPSARVVYSKTGWTLSNLQGP